MTMAVSGFSHGYRVLHCIPLMIFFDHPVAPVLQRALEQMRAMHAFLEYAFREANDAEITGCLVRPSMPRADSHHAIEGSPALVRCGASPRRVDGPASADWRWV